MNPSKLFGHWIEWYRLLPLLEIAMPVGGLPAVVRCPICSKDKLEIYDDPILGGAWYVCSGCSRSGDLVSLASRVWNTGLLQTIIRLEYAGFTFPSDIVSASGAAAHTSYISCTKKLAQLVEDSREYLTTRTDLRPFLGRVGVKKDQDPKIWRQRAGCFIGAMPRERLVESLAAVSGTRIRGVYSMGSDSLVVPFYDLPERLCGVLLVGSKEGLPQMYWSLHEFMSGKSPLEAGLCARTADFVQTDSVLLNRIYVFDPFTAAILHARHLNDTDEVLPIMGGYFTDGLRTSSGVRTLSSIKALAACRREIVLCCSKPTTMLLIAAASVGASVSCCSPSSRLTTKQQLIQFHKAAQPWQAVLDAVITQISNAELSDLIANAKSTIGLSVFLGRCSNKTRELIECKLNSVQGYRETTINGKTVIETADGWFVDKDKICDASLHVEEVLYTADTDDVYYRGHIQYGKHQLIFSEKEQTIKASTFEWMRRKLLVKGLGVLTYSPNWSKHALDLAMRFHKPKARCGRIHFGWDHQSACFLLPKFRLGSDGTIADADNFFEDTAPGWNLPKPDDTELLLDGLLEDTAVNKAYWAVSACIAANIVAPCLAEPTVPLALVGEGAKVLGRLTARACGCLAHKLTSSSKYTKSSIDIADELDSVLETNSWPVYLTISSRIRSNQLAVWIGNSSTKSAVLPMSRLHANIFGTVSDWYIVAEETAWTAANNIVENGPAALSSWLRYFCKTSGLPDGVTLARRVLSSMKLWAADFGEVCVFDSAAAAITDTTNPLNKALSFVATTVQCLALGWARFERDGFPIGGRKKPAITLILGPADSSGVFVPAAVLAAAAATSLAIEPPTELISSMLKAAGALKREMVYNGDSGWLLYQAWWERKVQTCQHSQHQFFNVGN